MRKFIVGFPRCGNQSHFETYGTSSLHDLIYDPDGVEKFKKEFPDHTPMILVRKDQWEHAYSLWARACKMEKETRKFQDCCDEYHKKSDFDKYIEPWLKAYPDIEILHLEELAKRPEFKKVDNFSIPHDYEKDVKSFIMTRSEN